MNKIFVDYDATICNTIKAIVALYNYDFQYYKKFKEVRWSDIETWEFRECKCATPEYIDTYFNQQRFFDTIDFMDHAEEVLDRLKDKYEIIVVSCGYSPNLIGKERWIKKHMPYAKFIGVNSKEHKDKAHIDMKGFMFIDDLSKNLASSNAKYKVCFGDYYNWNYKWDGERCFNWYDVEQYIKEINY